VLSTLVAREKPGFQALSKGLIVLLCAEVVRQGVLGNGALHSECSACTQSSENLMPMHYPVHFCLFVDQQIVVINSTDERLAPLERRMTRRSIQVRR